jgi:hypothetical protein
VLDGVDDVDWAGLWHARGRAVDMPALLRGLTSADAARRAEAFGELEASLLHQDDIFPATLAAIPLLIDMAYTAGLPDRARILRFLAALGDTGADEARDLIADATPRLLSLLVDTDVEVRRAVPAVFVVSAERTGATGALEERLAIEADPDARVAIARALIAVGRGVRGGRGPSVVRSAARAWLDLLGRQVTDPEAQQVAVIDLFRLGADDLRPLHPTAIAIALAAGLPVHHVCGALGDEAGTRIRLLTAALDSPDAGLRQDALRAAPAQLMCWRGPVAELLHLVRSHLDEAEPLLRARLVEALDGHAAERCDHPEPIDRTVAELAELWRQPGQRDRIAARVEEVGAPAAEVFVPLMRAELASTRRATAWDSTPTPDFVRRDERLLATCRRVLDRYAVAVDAADPAAVTDDGAARLLVDDRVGVRRTAPMALLCGELAAGQLRRLLRDRLDTEPDPGARAAILDAVRSIDRRIGTGFLPG